MKYKDIEDKSYKYANNIAGGYDKDYYNKIYNENLIKEVNEYLSKEDLIDISEKELVKLVKIYQSVDNDNLLSFIEKVINHSKRKLDYLKVIDLFIDN